MDPAVGSGYAFILWPIANGEEITKGKIKELDRLGVEAVDAHTLKVTLKAPTPYFIGMLTHPHAYPVHPKTLERHGDKWTRAGNLVSNGAYRLTEWVPQSHIRLERNPHYWDAADVRIDAVVFHPTEDTSTELKRFRSGELDITYDVPPDQIAWVEKNLSAVPQHRVSRHLLLCPQPHQGAVPRPAGTAQRAGHDHRPGNPHRQGHQGRRDPRLRLGAPGVNRYAGATVPWKGLSKAERFSPGRRSSTPKRGTRRTTL